MVRKLALVTSLTTVTLFLAGCSTATALAERDQPFVDYYPLMTDEQRVDFVSIQSTDARHDYIREQGLDIALTLENEMRVGMGTKQVGEILGDPWDIEQHDTAFGDRAGHHEAWFWRSFEGVSRPVIYSVRFLDGKVEGWSAWRGK